MFPNDERHKLCQLPTNWWRQNREEKKCCRILSNANVYLIVSMQWRSEKKNAFEESDANNEKIYVENMWSKPCVFLYNVPHVNIFIDDLMINSFLYILSFSFPLTHAIYVFRMHKNVGCIFQTFFCWHTTIDVDNRCRLFFFFFCMFTCYYWSLTISQSKMVSWIWWQAIAVSMAYAKPNPICNVRFNLIKLLNENSKKKQKTKWNETM